MSYQPYYQNQNEPMFAYVNSCDEAKAFAVPYGRSGVLLMDRNNPVFFWKTVDSMGQASMKAYKFEETTIENASQYVTKTEFDSLMKKLDAFMEEHK